MPRADTDREGVDSVEPQRRRRPERAEAAVGAVRPHRRPPPGRLREGRRLPGPAQGAGRHAAGRSAGGGQGIRACAVAAAPASRRGPSGASCPRPPSQVYLFVNADESEPGTFKDRFLLELRPAPDHRGHHHQLLRGAGEPRLHLHPRRVRLAHRPRAEGRRRGLCRGVSGEEHPRQRLRPRGDRPQRRRRLHLRRGDGPDRIRSRARKGQPRIKPPFPAVAGVFGGRPSSTTSRRWPRCPGSSSTAPRPTAQFGTEKSRRARSCSASADTSSGRASTRSRWACRSARSSTTCCGGMADGEELKAIILGGTLGAGATGGRDR